MAIVTRLTNQPYGSGPNQTCDILYVNDGYQSTRPIVPFFHGGGWGAGSFAGQIPILQILVENGFVAYGINFTPVVGGDVSTQWPVPVRDCTCWLNWVPGNGIGDVNRIYLWGYSSGAHLVMMAGLPAKGTFGSNCSSSSIAYTIVGIIGTATPIDLNTMYPITNAAGQTAISNLLGYIPSNNPSGTAVASPITYVAANPPSLFFQTGSLDLTVPPSQTDAIVTAFANIGITVQCTNQATLDHNMNLNTTNGLTFQQVESFLGIIASQGNSKLAGHTKLVRARR